MNNCIIIKKLKKKHVGEARPQMSMWISMIAAALLFSTSFTSVYAQDKKRESTHLQKLIFGQVVDEKNEPLQGVSVVIKGTTISVITDLDGTFTLSAEITPSTEIVFSFIGMETLTVAAKDRPEKSRWVLTLKESATMINEVFVTGYQNIKKNELTGSIKQVKAEDIMQSAKLSIDQMLAGQIAGMSVITSSGEPSATAKIRIRGTSSITSSKAPLWVLDGIILEDVDPGKTVNYSSLDGEDAAYLIGNAIAGINPQDIESINVLKDAAATALYGVQAANGVIVVTTKRGRIGAPKVSYNGSVAVNMRDYYANLYLMNAAERIELSMDIKKAGLSPGRKTTDIGWEGLMNAYDTKGPFENYAKIGLRADYEEALLNMASRNTDWYDLLFRNAITTNHNVSLSGGNEHTTYYASLGYTNSQGTALGSASERYTAMMKLTSWLNKKVYVNFQLNGSMSDNDGFYGSSNPDSWARTTARTIPAYYDDGSPFYYNTDWAVIGNGKQPIGDVNPAINPIHINYLQELQETGSEGKVSNLSAKLDLRWNIWDKLRYEVGGSVVNQNSTSESWASDRSHAVSKTRGYNYADPAVLHGSAQELVSPLPYGGIYSNGSAQQVSYTFRNQLAYEKEVITNHVFSAQAISEIRSILTEGYSGTAYGWRGDRGQLIAPQVTEQNWDAVTRALLSPSITDNVKNYVSWLGFASYSYKNKAILNGNVRMDGSNQFGDNPQYRFLPVWSVSGRYILTEEKFLKKNPVLSYFAFRASYGVQGNVDKSTSPDLVAKIEKYDSNLYFDMSSINMLPNPDLRWEKTRSYNAGIDFSLWNRRISGTVDYYKKMGTDMIMSTYISQVNGITSQKINAGDLENTGVEADIILYPVRTKNWEFSINVIYAYNVNKLTKATILSPKSTDDIRTSNNAKVAGSALIVGEPLNTLYAWRFAGLDNATGLPLFYEGGSATSIIDPVTGQPSTLDAGGVESPNYYVYREKADLVKVGVATPPSTGGINLSLRYKNFRLRSNMAYSLGGVKRLPALYNRLYDLFDPTVNVT
ncbi:MAG: SusC/RagA family TonB-linked outer membrane protein, partial [Prevotellaceae bacterium]|nr:SusC/RagA family TonB-linked outer membrane protein [Prevotellaceae bacterium]